LLLLLVAALSFLLFSFFFLFFSQSFVCVLCFFRFGATEDLITWPIIYVAAGSALVRSAATFFLSFLLSPVFFYCSDRCFCCPSAELLLFGFSGAALLLSFFLYGFSFIIKSELFPWITFGLFFFATLPYADSRMHKCSACMMPAIQSNS